MAGRIRFYRGAAGTSLPETRQNGAIFILEREGSTGFGDMYVDMENGHRLHIAPDNSLVPYYSENDKNADDPMISVPGMVYFCHDDNTPNGQSWVAVGDGSTPVRDLPKYTLRIQNAIKNKVNAYLGTEYLSLTDEQKAADTGVAVDSHLYDGISQSTAAETLVLSRELWLGL